ncbi:MAG: MFS transporter [Gammaproteobacteria bacterium]|nr:MFS transporter [Gammaproteobacteria bacterium]
MSEPLDRAPALDEDLLYAKITRRIIPFLFLCYVAAYLDRVNVGFAKLTMAADLHFSETVYGLGAGVFFLGYFFFEIPSNLLMHRIGARATLARIMLAWGVVSAATLLVSTPGQFYAMRFLLGVAEAGFFPGVVLYLTYWYPAARRGRAQALFVTAVAIAGVLGNPLSGWIMLTTQGLYGLQGWQWLLLLEGIPSVFLGCFALYWLEDRVAEARWLSAAERAHVAANIARDNEHKTEISLSAGLRDARVWLLALIYFCLAAGLYGINFWLPTLVRGFGVSDLRSIGLVSALPWAAALGCMVLVSRSSDLRRERRYHIAVPALVGAAGLALSVPLAGQPVLAVAALAVGTAGVMSALPLCWSLATTFLGGAAAAVGIAVINSFGNLSGFVSPYLVGFIRDATGSTDAGVYLLAGFMTAGALLVLLRVPANLVAR